MYITMVSLMRTVYLLCTFMKIIHKKTDQEYQLAKKVGNSVIRHHLTRLIRESYRLHEDVFNSGLDIVVIARATARNASYHEVESALMHLGRLHKIVHIDQKRRWNPVEKNINCID